ncbi:MAG: cupredoxin domain-containing protein [bacterium]
MRRMAALAAAVLLLWTFLPAAGSESGMQTIAITIRHSRFIPAHVTVRRGMTVRFVITNIDPIDHEFILGDEAVQRRHEGGTEPEHGEVPGEVSVRAGATAETTYTFSRPGLLLIGCHAPGHYAYGMRGWVWVAH